MSHRHTKLWNPYVAGIALGLVLLTAFLVAGKGLGASGAVYRFGIFALNAVAPEHVAGHEFLSRSLAGGDHPLHAYYVFLLLGVVLGAVVSSYTGGRMGLEVVRGPRASVPLRLGLALVGGVLMGFAARLSRGCTSGQALSGGALLSVGSWVFMLSVFAGGYALAYFVRRQWT
jgi:hypothetical protein